MKLRDDINPVNTWVVSDSHFGHDNIQGFCHRPLDHDQVMIAEWRAQVPDDATVIHLGDLAYRSNARFKHIVAKELTGRRKLLILGNHDRQRFSFYKASGFQIVRPFAIEWGVWQLVQGRKCPWRVSFSHYPWNAAEEGRMLHPDIRIHGHVHNNGYTRDAYVPFLKQHLNLSVEQTKYRPVNLKLLLDAALLGVYPETTDAQATAARDNKERAQNGG